jgi:hypothetical protein
LITVRDRAHFQGVNLSKGELQGRFQLTSMEILTNHFLSE